MRMENTNDLASFMDQLKEWAKNYGHRPLFLAIDGVESTCFSASELIVRYAETLRDFRNDIPEALPPSFRENWEPAIKIGLDAVETVTYEETSRPLFSLS